MKQNLRTLGIGEVAGAAGAFAVGLVVGLAGMLLFVSEDGDVGLMGGRVGLGLLVAIPLVITPFVYLVGFVLQEGVLADRSRTAHLISAAVSGLAYVCLLRASTAVAVWCEARLDGPTWLGLLLVIPVWLLGPLAVALLSMRVERRIKMKGS
jgi:hypothetical protein